MQIKNVYFSFNLKEMSSLVEIKKRIVSITSTIKVTKVMQMIATAKIVKIKQMISCADKYNSLINSILAEYIKNTGDKDKINFFFEKKNETKEKKKILLFLMSSDKGTCGSINTNIFKEFNSIVKQHQSEGHEIFVYPIGKKAKKYLESHSTKLNINIFSNSNTAAENYDNKEETAMLINNSVEEYTNGNLDAIYFVYHKFKNIITCNVVCEQVLPLVKNTNDFCDDNVDFINIDETDSTPSKIIELFVRTKFHNAYVSNLASIVSSRMNAMDNATKNGQEIIDDLRIKYNKGRQANITSELSDIVSGFEAIN